MNDKAEQNVDDPRSTENLLRIYLNRVPAIGVNEVEVDRFIEWFDSERDYLYAVGATKNADTTLALFNPKLRKAPLTRLFLYGFVSYLHFVDQNLRETSELVDVSQKLQPL